MFETDGLLAPDRLPIIWFVLIGALLAGYLILDGFDLGAGILHLLVARGDTERRLTINSIGPLWDGNEVWLVTFGGALLAMFPYAYAAAFQAFYTPFCLLLFALIFRAVSIEFRGKMGSTWARHFWDFGFFAGSLLTSFLLGVTGGNVLAGLELNERGQYIGSLADQLQPYAVATGLLVVALFTLHGAIFLHLKLRGDFQHRVATAMRVSWVAFVLLYATVSIWTVIDAPRAIDNFRAHPGLWLIPAVNVILVAFTGLMVWKRRALAAFLCNAAMVASLVVLLAIALFPNMINAVDPAADLRIVDAASSARTLRIGLLFVAIGLPFVLLYTGIVYWTFRGETRIESHSY